MKLNLITYCNKLYSIINPFRFLSAVSHVATSAEIIETIDAQFCRGDARFIIPEHIMQRGEFIPVANHVDVLAAIFKLHTPEEISVEIDHYHGMMFYEKISRQMVQTFFPNYKPGDYFNSYFSDEPINFYDSLSIMNESLLIDNYSSILIFLIISIIIAFVIAIASYALSIQKPDTEKFSTYECGFEPYEDARHTFDIKFCLIAILFIIFDIEVLYVISWSIGLSKLDILGVRVV
jgi:NADH-quinone oxidoreductase subunit A